MRVENIQVLSCIVAMMLASVANTAVAQDPEATDDSLVLEEVIVTATKRAVNLQDVPQAITAMSERMIDDIGAQDFSGMVDAVPGVEYRTVQAGIGSVSVRGISELNTANVPAGGTGSSVGYYLGELPMTMAGVFPGVMSFDVARVEVLRGPQGTLYGEGSLAGTIRLVPNAPNATAFSGKADLTYSSTKEGGGNSIGNVMLNVPLAEDTLALRVSGFYNDMSGFIDTVSWVDGALMKKDANTSETIGGRAALEWTPNEDLTITASAFISNAERGTKNKANESFQQATSVLEFQDDDMSAYNLTIDYAFAAADLVSSTSFFDRDIYRHIDQGGIVPAVNFVLGFAGLSADGVYSDQIGHSEAFAQEVRLVSTGSGPWQWTVGGFYKEQEFFTNFTGETVPAVPPEVTAAISTAILGVPMQMLFIGNSGTTEQKALFGEVSYDITDKFQLLAGARVFSEKRDSTSQTDGLFSVLLTGNMPATVFSSGDDDVFNPKLTATYAFNDDSMGYATASKGFRSGGQNDFFSLVPGAPVTFDPETLTNYEIGYKSTWLDRSLVFNAAAYYMDWSDLQAVTLEGQGGLFEAQDNVGDAHSMGVDLELMYKPVEGLTLSLAATLLEAETDEDFVVADPAGTSGVTISSGNRIPGTAETTLSAYGEYRFQMSDSLGGMARLSYAYTGDSTVMLTRPDFITPSYHLVNARFSVEAEKWEVSIFADNLTDEFVTYSVDRTVQPFTGMVWAIGRPRTFGVNLRFIF